MGNSGVWGTILLTVFALTTVGCGESESVIPEGGEGTPVVMTLLVFLQVVFDRRMAEISGPRAAGLVGQWLVPGTSHN